jgi:hypothetical protein
MQVSNPNDVKIYNLSAGKSLPEVSHSNIDEEVMNILFIINYYLTIYLLYKNEFIIIFTVVD